MVVKHAFSRRQVDLRIAVHPPSLSEGGVLGI